MFVFILLLASIVPTVVYVTILWWLDKYEKEPWGLFLAAFIYGAIPAIIASILLELPFELLFGDVLTAVVIAPLVEESVKGFAVLLIFLLWRKEFDGVLDGILYGAAVGFGFAMVENFAYFLGNQGDPGVILMRTIPFGLNHALFTSVTGAGLGLARQSRQRSIWLLYFPAFLALAMGLHAVHNLGASTGCAGLGLAVYSDWGGIVILLVVALLAWAQEKRWIRQELADEVAAGLLAGADYQALLSLRKRIGARLWAWQHHGWQAYRLMGRFFNLATELAFRKHHLRAGTAQKGTFEEMLLLRQKVRETRSALLGLLGASAR